MLQRPSLRLLPPVQALTLRPNRSQEPSDFYSGLSRGSRLLISWGLTAATLHPPNLVLTVTGRPAGTAQERHRMHVLPKVPPFTR